MRARSLLHAGIYRLKAACPNAEGAYSRRDTMTQNQKPKTPSQQDPEQGNEIDPRLKEPVGPGQQQSALDEPGHPRKKNPGHANPAHNTPGHTRQNQPGQQDPGQAGQGQTQSYPGIKGPKARALQEDSPPDKQQVHSKAEKDPRSELGLKSPTKDSAPRTPSKSEGSGNDQ